MDDGAAAQNAMAAKTADFWQHSKLDRFAPATFRDFVARALPFFLQVVR